MSSADMAPSSLSFPSESFRVSSLWRPARINPITSKSLTIPIFNLRSPYGRNFHLSWLGFFVAFLSWFAFPPLLTLSIKSDLRLTQVQIANSNIVALLATFVVRVFVGPLVDRFGPRLVMAWLLIVGAVPSGLAGTIHSANGLYAIRFFIGILGGTFVPCQAWTTVFFDSSIVGIANAIVAGLGNAGGGATYAVMVALYDRLHRHLSQHIAWRVAFVVVPVPILLLVAIMILVVGTDHPRGKWRNRDTTDATVQPPRAFTSDDEKGDEHAREERIVDSSDASTSVSIQSHLGSLLIRPATYIPCLAYLSTFGFELAVDSTLATTLVGPHPGLGQLNAGYLASVFGLMNIFTRPLGGALGDLLYRRWLEGPSRELRNEEKGVRSKRYLFLILGLVQGLFSIGFGKYLESSSTPRLDVMMGLVVLISLFNGMANGANFAYVPHCNPLFNGAMCGLVGAFGNLGGVMFALIFRFQLKLGVAWMTSGIVAAALNGVLIVFAGSMAAS